jgi:capsular polysaccharide biosynthesis protein/Mrp family chromosome partitioning ATPase
MLRRQAWLVALVVLIAIATSIAVTSTQDDVYRSSMKIVVGQRGGLLTVGSSGAIEPLTQTLSNLLESDVVAATVIERLDLDKSPRGLLGQIHVSSAPESAVLEVSYTTTQRQTAARILGEVGAVFTELVDEKLGRAAQAELPITASIFDPAHLNPGTIAPRPNRNMAIAGALGLALGLILAFIRESLDDRVRGRRDAERWFGAPVIGALPKGVRGKPPFGVAGRPAPSKASLVESLQLLRANLQFSEAGMKGPTALVTSALPEEGKSSVVANVGVSLAMAGFDVVCVEADMRRPRLQHLLGLKAQRYGLVEVVDGQLPVEEALQEVTLASGGNGALHRARASGNPRSETRAEKAAGGRLRVLPAGALPSNPADVLTSDGVQRLIDDLRKDADYILIDTPPILLVGDAFPLVRVSDNIIVVAREGRTRRGTAQAVRATLESLVGVPRVSVVLTDWNGREAAYGYGEAYGQAAVVE